MNKSDEYRRHAELCGRMADAAANEGEKSEWLALARSWREMIRSHGPAYAAGSDNSFCQIQSPIAGRGR